MRPEQQFSFDTALFKVSRFQRAREIIRSPGNVEEKNSRCSVQTKEDLQMSARVLQKEGNFTTAYLHHPFSQDNDSRKFIKEQKKFYKRTKVSTHQ